MAYASWSVVFGEQPTAAKWNILGTNDASFNDGTGLPIANSAGAVVTTGEATSSTSYTDLATTTDTVTVTVGTNAKALVILSAAPVSNTSGTLSYISFAASGANTIASSDTRALYVGALTGLSQGQGSWGYMATGLTPGSTTFKMKYRVSGGSTTFSNRYISVITI